MCPLHQFLTASQGFQFVVERERVGIFPWVRAKITDGLPASPFAWPVWPQSLPRWGHSIGGGLAGCGNQRRGDHHERARRHDAAGIYMPAHTTLDEASRFMEENACGTLIVLDGAGRLAGILTDRDLALTIGRTESRPSDVSVVGR